MNTNNMLIVAMLAALAGAVEAFLVIINLEYSEVIPLPCKIWPQEFD